MGGKKKKKTTHQRRRADDDDNDDDKVEDRFDTDNKPQFRSLSTPLEQQKVVLDDRFASVLTDPRFQLSFRDKYGRTKKSKQKSESNKELEAFYSVPETEGKEKEGKGGKDEKEQSEKSTIENDEQSDRSCDDESDEEDVDNSPANDKDQSDPVSRIAYLTALSRGELDVSSSSSEEEEDEEAEQKDVSGDESGDDDDEGDDAIVGKAGILDPSYPANEEEKEVELTYEPSKYLAILNMEWSHVRAVDIFAICASFCPPGAVERVQIYPSDFGMERIAKEDQFGPTGLWKKNTKKPNQPREDEADSDENSSDEEEDDKSSSDESAKSGKKGAASENDDRESDSEDEQLEQEDEQEEGDDDKQDVPLDSSLPQEDHIESDFDPEKLREYEASRLKYYFAVVTFASDGHADVCYREVDGMEFEHSSAAMDVRAIPPSELPGVLKNRPLRDEATSVPSNYVPPEFIVSALQHSNVKCNWEAGDDHRDRLLTKYTTAGQDWKTIAESDDLKAYLASDASSGGDEEEENSDEEDGGKTKKKAVMMRKMLGLDDGSGDEGSDDGGEKETKIAINQNSSENESDVSSNARSDDGMEDGEDDKQTRFIPGASSLAEKIRFKVEQKSIGELTPWEKYQQKRKERKKKKKEEAKEKRESINKQRRGKVAHNSNEDADSNAREDSFLVDGAEQSNSSKSKRKQKIKKEELELLVAGDDEDEEKRDFDMRDLQRMEKNKDKKLRGARKRKEAEKAAAVSGTDFQVNLQDNRFSALLDGQDARFGIDRTDPNFKDTPAMRQVLEEQGRRRNKKKRRKGSQEKNDENVSSKDSLAQDVAAGNRTGKSEGASSLSTLVSRLKSKVQ